MIFESAGSPTPGQHNHHPYPYQISSPTARRQSDSTVAHSNRKLTSKHPYPQAPSFASQLPPPFRVTDTSSSLCISVLVLPRSSSSHLRRPMLHILAILQLEAPRLHPLAPLPVHPPLMHIHAGAREERDVKHTSANKSAPLALLITSPTRFTPRETRKDSQERKHHHQPRNLDPPDRVRHRLAHLGPRVEEEATVDVAVRGRDRGRPVPEQPAGGGEDERRHAERPGEEVCQEVQGRVERGWGADEEGEGEGVGEEGEGGLWDRSGQLTGRFP